MEYVIIHANQTNHFIQGCVEHPPPPPHATDHPTPHDLQGSVSKAVWSFSENSTKLETPIVPYLTNTFSSSFYL